MHKKAKCKHKTKTSALSSPVNKIPYYINILV